MYEKRSVQEKVSQIVLKNTCQGNNSYPKYKRWFRDPRPINGNIIVDNKWVVPYNPWLLLKYDCNINVEVCNNIKGVKYLYKYVYRDHDQVAMEVCRWSHVEEVQQYINAQWICAPEAFRNIFRFTLYIIYLCVERLQIHLSHCHQVKNHWCTKHWL